MKKVNQMNWFCITKGHQWLEVTYEGMTLRWFQCEHCKIIKEELIL